MKLRLILLIAVLFSALVREAAAQTTATLPTVGFLNVQGVLHQNGVPINGFWDWCFGLYATPSGGTRLATDTNMNNNVLVSNGLANVFYNLGNLATLNLSPTQELYLELDARPSGTSNAFTVLSPRQRIVPSLFATMSVRAEEARRLIEPLPVGLLPASVARLDRSATFSSGTEDDPPLAVSSSDLGFSGQTGTAQGSFYLLRGITTDTNSTELFRDGASLRIHVASNSTWLCDVRVTARDATGASAGFQVRRMIGYDNAGNLVSMGVPIADQFAGGPAVTAQVVADNVRKALTVHVRWNTPNPNPVRWVATVSTTEVKF